MSAPIRLETGQWCDWNQGGKGPTILFHADGSCEWVSIVAEDGQIYLPTLPPLNGMGPK